MGLHLWLGLTTIPYPMLVKLKVTRVETRDYGTHEFHLPLPPGWILFCFQLLHLFPEPLPSSLIMKEKHHTGCPTYSPKIQPSKYLNICFPTKGLDIFLPLWDSLLVHSQHENRPLTPVSLSSGQRAEWLMRTGVGKDSYYEYMETHWHVHPSKDSSERWRLVGGNISIRNNVMRIHNEQS